MNVHHLSWVSLCFVFILSHVQMALGSAVDLLPEKDRAAVLEKVKKGEQVAVFENVKGSSWPKALIFQRIDATPEEAAAVFTDYKLHSTYFPYITQSKPNRVKNNLYYVDYLYERKIPVFGSLKEAYTTINALTFDASTSTYKVDWGKVKASSLKAIEGFASFEPLGTGTMVAYYNFMVPDRMGSGLKWVVDGMKQSTKDSVTALVTKIQTERIEDQQTLQRQIQELRSALSF